MNIKTQIPSLQDKDTNEKISIITSYVEGMKTEFSLSVASLQSKIDSLKKQIDSLKGEA